MIHDKKERIEKEEGKTDKRDRCSSTGNNWPQIRIGNPCNLIAQTLFQEKRENEEMQNEKRTLYYHNIPMVIFEQVTIQNRKFVKLNCSNFIARAQDLISRCEISVMF